MTRRVTAIAMFVLAAISSVAPIRSYDFFWHLATGRWIVEHRGLPLYDPFTVAAAHVPWINGEWLYEIVLYGAHAAAGLAGISWWNALFVAALFSIAFWYSSREQSVAIALAAVTVAFAGALPRLGIRPSAAAAFLIVIAIGVLQSPISTRTTTVLYALITIVWINMHPSALLAPLIAAAVLLSDRRRWPVPVASAFALLVNPYGWRAVVAPLELTRMMAAGAFVNAEWVPSAPVVFPLLYATIVTVVILYLIFRPARADVWRVLVFAGLAILAARHVRDQGLYFAAVPLLLPPIRPARFAHSRVLIVALLALVPVASLRNDHGAGVDADHFPVRAVARLHALALPGNIYNADQFGGYLEWAFYPQRRVVTDGRNELFRDFILLDARAHRDSRAWQALLRTFDIAIAVDEYAPPLEVVDAVTGTRRLMPASAVRYPRRDWALIAYDDVAMVFARRSAFSPERLQRIELK